MLNTLPFSTIWMIPTRTVGFVARKPKVVMMAIGGGVQERLGYALRRQLSYKPAILCLGAARTLDYGFCL